MYLRNRSFAQAKGALCPQIPLNNRQAGVVVNSTSLASAVHAKSQADSQRQCTEKLKYCIQAQPKFHFLDLSQNGKNFESFRA